MLTPRSSRPAPLLLALSVACLLAAGGRAQKAAPDYRGAVLTSAQLETLFRTPPCLAGYRPGQSGPLRRLDAPEGQVPTPTYTIEPMKISSDGLLINGWLYLPGQPGKRPLVVLTNGGGNSVKEKWFAMFGAIDRTVPTEASVKNILRDMALSGNNDFAVAVIPRCGHTPVDVETKQRVRFENLTLNWISENVVPLPPRPLRPGSSAISR